MSHHHHEEKHHHEHEEKHDKHHKNHHEDERYERREEEYSVENVRYNEGGYGNRPPMGGYGEGPASGYGGYGGGPVTVQTTEVSQAQVRLNGIEQARVHETTYQRTEYAGVAGAVLGAGVAMYESHRAKIDPTNAARHKLEAEIAGGVGVVGAGVGMYGHHQKENSEEQREELETGHKKHSWF